jgi:hypothetical protein
VNQLHELGLPDNVVTAWFGNLRGLNSMADVAAMGIVGRPLPEEHALGRMAAALTGHPVSGRYELGGEVERLVRASGGLWWRTGVAASHPDVMAQRLLESTRDGEVWQAVGRPRAVNRSEEVVVHLLSDAVMPCPVELADVWDEAKQEKENPFARMLDAGGMAFASAAHAARAYPEMWRSKQAASKILTGQLSLYKTLYIREVDQSCALTELEYRIPRAKDFCIVLVDMCRHPDAVAALLDVLPEAVDVRVLAPPEVQKPQLVAHNETAKRPKRMQESWAIPAGMTQKEAFSELRGRHEAWKQRPAVKRAAGIARWMDTRAVAAPP